MIPPAHSTHTFRSECEDYTESDDEGQRDYKPGGYHPVKIGEVYHGRYRIEAKLGWGHFSTVWLASDWKVRTPAPRYVAIKFQKSAHHYFEAAHDEIELLKTSNCPPIRVPSYAESASKALELATLPAGSGVVDLVDYFVHEGPHGTHVCMVFEVMGPNLLQLIKQYSFQGIPFDLARKISVHVLVGLDHLHRRCHIIHTDLKPENVLVSRDVIPLTTNMVQHLQKEHQAQTTEQQSQNTGNNTNRRNPPKSKTSLNNKLSCPPSANAPRVRMPPECE
ncbi:protein kinase domain protein, partial [Gregarina niphandrodes]